MLATFRRQPALIACQACIICIAAAVAVARAGDAAPPATGGDAGAPAQRVDADAGAEADDFERLTRMIRQLADRTAGEEGAAPPSAGDAPPRRADPNNPADPANPAQPVDSGDAAGRPDRSDADAGADAGAGAGAAVDPNELKRLGPSDADAADDGRPRFSYSGDGAWVMQTITALGIVIALIFALRWVWTRLAGTQAVASTPVVEMLSRTAVAPRNHVLLLRVGRRILIVSDSSAGMQTLASVDDEQEVAELLAAISASKADSISGSFQQLLSRFGRTHEDTDDPHHLAWSEDDGRDHSEHVFDRARDNVSGLASRIRSLSRKGGGA